MGARRSATFLAPTVFFLMPDYQSLIDVAAVGLQSRKIELAIVVVPTSENRIQRLSYIVNQSKHGSNYRLFLEFFPQLFQPVSANCR
jgi:hypothetical protein